MCAMRMKPQRLQRASGARPVRREIGEGGAQATEKGSPLRDGEPLRGCRQAATDMRCASCCTLRRHECRAKAAIRSMVPHTVEHCNALPATGGREGGVVPSACHSVDTELLLPPSASSGRAMLVGKLANREGAPPVDAPITSPSSTDRHPVNTFTLRLSQRTCFNACVARWQCLSQA